MAPPATTTTTSTNGGTHQSSGSSKHAAVGKKPRKNHKTEKVERNPTLSLSTAGGKNEVQKAQAVQAPFSGTTTHLLVQPHAAMKVIKGEIHNVLTVMRADQRYASTNRSTEESVRHYSDTFQAQQFHHPVAQGLYDLHVRLTEEQAAVAASNSSTSSLEDTLDVHLYLPPFCRAVQGRDISARVTGAALAALYKFLLYGFILPESSQAVDGMTMIADALLNCTFEESTDKQARRLYTGSGLNSSAHSSAQAYNDEQVVLQLLEVSALTVRCSLQTINLIPAEKIVGLLDTCLHVSHKAVAASPLLKAAASSALGQMVLQVFAGTGAPVMEARHQILAKLASLLHPALHTEAVTTSSLTMVNIALETCREPLTEREVRILRDDLCKYLLQWSTSQDLLVLQLTLRVIFNLYQSIRNHLKVPLEVFLTSVHIRIVEHDGPVEQREVALESLVEFCQEPALLQDLYLNYDCDVACTDLYKAIVTALGKVATPVSTVVEAKSRSTSWKAQSKEAAAAGISPPPASGNSQATASAVTIVSPPVVNNLHRLALHGLMEVLDSIAKRCLPSESYRYPDDDDLETPLTPMGMSDAELQEQRRKKESLISVAEAFNNKPSSSEWKQIAKEEGLVDSVESAKGIADILWSAPHVDKEKLGIYLSKGPTPDYPFEAEVRKFFVQHYDFADHTFAFALRKFLSKFRLPGEAQCIDRLMEAFSGELFRQQGETTYFKTADAAYVLAFSTIMLNTDLHNPTIKHERRMTKAQFVRNNRGINDGEDLPEEFLSELYDQIRDKQIQVRRELGEFMKKHDYEDFRTAWDNLLAKQGEVATASFTPAGTFRKSSASTAVHDREMFEILAKAAIPALSGIFATTDDDGLVVRTLRGLKEIVELAASFEMDTIINDALKVLLKAGRDYVKKCIYFDHNQVDGGASVVSHARTVGSNESGEEDERSVLDVDQPIPYGLLSVSTGDSDVDITGSAAHRGLLALDVCFIYVRQHTSRISDAWPPFLEILCSLRDANALPSGLAELDDFADSSGNVLPLSSFAKASLKRFEDSLRKTGKETGGKSWFGAFFKKTKAADLGADRDDGSVTPGRGENMTPSDVLFRIADAADLESVVQAGPTQEGTTEKSIKVLLDTLDYYPYTSDAAMEQRAIFSLELAARALLSSREQASELFMMFLQKFETVFGQVSEKNVPAPFVIERIVVTILRASIHLYEIPELQPNLRASLQLFMTVLPRNFIRQIANRISCGMAIILRNSFQYFTSFNDWNFLGDALDMLANINKSRVFVFDGIASTVEYALPDDDPEDDRPTLNMETCNALSRILIRFILGFYQGDVSLSVPAMVCLEKVYGRKVVLLLEKAGKPKKYPLKAAPDKEAWQNIAVAVYSVCRSTDGDTSGHGVESFQRVILGTAIEEIAEEKWLAIMYLIVNKQPPLAADESRANTFAILGQLMRYLLPRLSLNDVLRDDLYDLVGQTASLAEENLRQGRRGPLFEKTVGTVTDLSNLLMTKDQWKGDPEFGTWAGETLLAELENVGAAGASIKNQAAVKQRPHADGDMPALPETGESGDED